MKCFDGKVWFAGPSPNTERRGLEVESVRLCGPELCLALYTMRQMAKAATSKVEFDVLAFCPW